MVDILMQLSNNDTGDKSLVNPNSSVLLNGGGGGHIVPTLFMYIAHRRSCYRDLGDPGPP